MHRRLTCRSPGAREHGRQPLLQYRKFLPLITSPFQRSIRSHSVPYQDQNRCQCFATCASSRKITSHYTSIWNIAVTNMVKYSNWKHLVCLHNIWAVSYSMLFKEINEHCCCYYQLPMHLHGSVLYAWY